MDPADAISWQFDDDVWQHGVLLHQRGGVSTLVYDNESDTWTARVRDTGPRPHEVWLGFEDESEDDDLLVIDGDCDCRAAKPCMHLAAVARAVVDEIAEPRKRGPVAPHLLPSPTAFLQWALTTERALDRANEASAPTPAPVTTLRFVIGVDSSAHHAEPRPRLLVTTFSVSPRRNRRATGPVLQRFDLGETLRRQVGRPHAWLTAQDELLWIRLQTAARREAAAPTYASHGALVSYDAAGLALLAEIVATGRCHLDAPTGLLLESGPARAGRITWHLDDRGRQLLHVEPADDDPTPWLVLPTAPLCYVEPATGRCGSITLDVDVAMQPWLTTVPAVDPEWSTSMPADAANLLRRTGIPAPRKLRTKPRKQGTPTPVLRLAARTDGDHKRPTATLELDYEGIRIKPDDSRAQLVRIDDDAIFRIDRDVHAEAQARVQLARHGLFGNPHAMTMPDEGAWYDLARLVAPALTSAGWRVEIDDEFEWTALGVDEWYANARDDDDDREAWFLELGVVVDGERINILPAVVAAIRTGTITRERLQVADRPLLVALPDGRRIELDRARVQMMLDVLVELQGEHALHGDALRLVKLDAVRVHDLPGFTWDIGPRLRMLADRLRHGPTTAVLPPAGLAATLRDYQCHGLSWLQWLREGELGGILADDMGLGKTVQALAHVLLEKQAGRLAHPVLVVAPRSVLRNWQREAERFTPDLRVAIYHGPFRHAITAALGKYDIVITTYALLQRDDALAAARWQMVVLDEAQAIKNPVAKVSIAARALVADQRVCMTGTPMENNLGDLWSLMTFVNPGLLGTSRQFTSWYRTPIEKHGDVGRFDSLCKRIAPFLLRRTKAQVLTELPPKTEVVLHAELDGPQRDLYESVRLTMEKRVREELGRRGLARSNIIVLDALLKLRQVCCDPKLVKLAQAARVRTSAKLELLMELVEELVGEGRRALVFSQFTSMLALIERELVEREIPWMSITGKTVDRQAVVDRFQAGLAPILLVSLKAGGTGLNLTAADTVIHYDPWWNPAVEAQATDRAHRIGQSQPITVYRLICEGTVEERMLALQAKKSALMRGVHDSAERRAGAGLALDEQEIAALLAPIGAS